MNKMLIIAVLASAVLSSKIPVSSHGIHGGPFGHDRHRTINHRKPNGIDSSEIRKIRTITKNIKVRNRCIHYVNNFYISYNHLGKWITNGPYSFSYHAAYQYDRLEDVNGRQLLTTHTTIYFSAMSSTGAVWGGNTPIYYNGKQIYMRPFSMGKNYLIELTC